MEPLHASVMGPPGAGKGTQARQACIAFDLALIATGDLFRRALELRTPLGMRARAYMERGELVPDDVVYSLVQEFVRQLPAERGALFDGFPRTGYQAGLLDEMLGDAGRRLVVAVYLDVADEVAVDRLAARLVCADCGATYHERFRPPGPQGECRHCGGELARRHDDDPATVRARLRTFHRTIDGVLSYYEASDRLTVIDGAADLASVTAEVHEVLAAARQRQRQGVAAKAPPRWHPSLGRMPAAPAPPAAVAPVTTRDLVLLGGPGSGKGTQAAELSTALALPHISTGDLFREHLREGTPLGQLAKTYMDRGELVPDEVTEDMVRDRLGRHDTAEGFVLDGYPRTRAQAQALDEMLAAMGRQVTAALHIVVSDDEITRRLSGRLICRQCQTPYHTELNPPKQPSVCDVCGGELYQREDDKPETVAARLRVFHGSEAPLLERYRAAGILRSVDGEGPPAEVTARLLAAATPNSTQ